MLELGLRDPENLKLMDFHKYSFSKFAFMLNATSKSENETILITQIESSRNVTSKVISNRIKARKSESTEQYDCKLFFRLDGTCNSIVELTNSTGWDFDSTIKFNASTGEEYCEWFVCGVCGTPGEQLQNTRPTYLRVSVCFEERGI